MAKPTSSTASSACPCGSGLPYSACCGRYHDGGAAAGQAPTPEALMRSRYSAFVLDLRPYLLATWHASTRPGEIEPPEPGLKWLGLEVRQAPAPAESSGLVAFVARYKIGGRAHRLEENSEFVREEGRWYYVKARADAS
ncbi:YchJ family protein [Aquabacterium sp.]|uniref:YchJ family protein n=1 Tax=Aquabacterium sp. TaxID=1872578 RepID=UPI0035ADC3D0